MLDVIALTIRNALFSRLMCPPSRFAQAMAVSVLIAVAGCDPQVEQRSTGSSTSAALAELVGKECTVQFRRGDAMGADATFAVQPNTTQIAAASVAVTGTLKGVKGEWIHIEVTVEYREGGGGPPRTIYRQLYIPTASVLYIETSGQTRN